MRKLFLIFFVLPVSGWAQIKLDAYQAGTRIGTAKYSSEDTKTGGRSTTMSIEIEVGMARGTTVVETQVVDREGRQLSSVIQTVRHGKVLNSMSASYAANGDVTLIASNGARKSTKTVAFNLRASRKDPSNFWFIRTRPSAGTWDQYANFDLEAGKWLMSKATFVGRKPTKVGGRNVLANVLSQTRGEKVESLCLDDKGDPLLIVSGQTRLERKW